MRRRLVVRKPKNEISEEEKFLAYAKELIDIIGDKELAKNREEVIELADILGFKSFVKLASEDEWWQKYLEVLNDD